MFIMETIESVVWIITGFISTLIGMEIAWRLARKQAKRVSVNEPVAVNVALKERSFFVDTK